ncbi:MAG: EAL domain-containing protein [Candidatus Baltobacteraceae bacterium]|jgi:Amt family ammonium transporter
MKPIKRARVRAKNFATAADKERSHLAAIVESSFDPIFSRSIDGIIASWNSAAERLFGFTAGEIVGKSVEILIPERYRNVRLEKLECLDRGERIEPFDTVFRRKGGSEVEVSVTASPIKDESGAIVGISTIARDISERKQWEETRLRLASIVECSDDAIVSRSLDGVITTWNSAAERLFGFAAEELIGKSMWILIPESHHDEQLEIFARLGRGERIESFETTRRRKDGSLVEVSMTISPLKDESGSSAGVSVIARDITEMKRIQRALVQAKDAAQAAQKAMESAKELLEHEVAERKGAEAQLRYAAYHDALTGLLNRPSFLDRLKRALERTRRHPALRVAVLFVDIDRFKVINDSLGHVAGDQLLAAFGERLTNCLRSYDVVARLGGDEFTILLDDVASARDATLTAERMQRAIKQPFSIAGRDVSITASIGIALGEPGVENAEAMLRDADTAMYRAKELGRARYEVFARELHLQAMARLNLEIELRRSLEGGELSLAYQPIVALETGRVTGFEALARWKNAGEMISPTAFIPLAEETGLIHPLGEWVLVEACRQARIWRELRPEGPPLTVSVNVSAKQLSAELLEGQVARVLADSGLRAEDLHLEITEGVLTDRREAAETTLGHVRSLGVTIDLDDFGTGYSSLSYLQRLPIDAVKIDRSFISGAGGPGISNPEIVAAIIAMAHSLGLGITAEGVETAEQLSQLRALHCTSAQGYYLSGPVDEARARALVIG